MAILNQIFSNLRELTPVSVLVRMLLAVLCAGMVGLERRNKKRVAGFRTYILVTLGATIVVLTNLFLIATVNPKADPARLGAQVINGIGFLGIGSIIISGSKRVKGLTTAAGLWGCACIGLAIGAGFFEVAVLGSSMIFISMTVLHRLEGRIDKNSPLIDLFVEFEEKQKIPPFVNYLRKQNGSVSSVQIASSRDPVEHSAAAVISVKFPEKFQHGYSTVGVGLGYSRDPQKP
jgi:putative Mg2+ transporter-C (MgtC) family protein